MVFDGFGTRLLSCLTRGRGKHSTLPERIRTPTPRRKIADQSVGREILASSAC